MVSKAERQKLLRRAHRCIARAVKIRDPEAKAALLEMAAMLEGLVERAESGERFMKLKSKT
jgi:hypothetical protein